MKLISIAALTLVGVLSACADVGSEGDVNGSDFSKENIGASTSKELQAQDSDVTLMQGFSLKELAGVAKELQDKFPEFEVESGDFRELFLDRLAEIQAERSENGAGAKLQSMYLPGTGK